MRRLLSLAVLGLAACARAHHVDVLVYNIHAGADAAHVPSLDRVASVVRDSRADIVLLQEVDRGVQRSNRVDQAAELARLTGFHSAFGKTIDYQGGEYGIAILSRWPITWDTLVHLPVRDTTASYEARGALQATIAAPFGAIHALTTHLDATGRDDWRNQQIHTVLELAKWATFVGGDFNSEPTSAVQDSARAAGLRDAWMLCGRGPALTWPADSGRKRIDYLLLHQRDTCDAARVLDTQASDHRPLLVRVKLR